MPDSRGPCVALLGPTALHRWGGGSCISADPTAEPVRRDSAPSLASIVPQGGDSDLDFMQTIARPLKSLLPSCPAFIASG